MKELQEKQKVLRSYPPVFLHTLFHEHSKYEKYRNYEISSLFFFIDDIKMKGNDAHRDNDLYLALEFYERSLSFFNWLEMVGDEKYKDFQLFGKDVIEITDDKVISKLKPLEDEKDLLEIENLFSICVNYL